MAKLIDAEQLKQQKTVLWDPVLGFCDCVLVEDIDKAPAVNAVEVVHGRWKWGRNSMNQYGAWCTECECGWEDKGNDFDRVQGLVIAHKYCPNCGAKMDLEASPDGDAK